MRVIFIIAAGEGDGVIRAKPRQRVDVGIGVVAGQIFLVKPEHPFRAQVFLQALFYGWLRQTRVAVVVEQALPRGHDSAKPVAFDTAAF